MYKHLDESQVQLEELAGSLEIQVKERTEELESALQKAKLSAKTKSEFLATMSHEIRTPMNGVLGMLGLLLNTELNSEQQHRATLAQGSAQSLLTLINDILDFSKVDAGKLELELLDFNLNLMLGEFAEAMAYQAEKKELELILDVKGVEQSTVKGDSGRLRQILTNLVGNAIKFTEKGEVLIRVDLQDISEQQWQFNCSIIDSGIGIPEDKLNLLFESFSQVDASTTRKYGGTGLGLAITKKLCKLMNGEINASSVIDKGSQFDVTILLDKSEQLETVVIPQVDMNTLNLLIVDDNSTNREVLRGQLEHWGATVVEAEDARHALDICVERVQQENLPFFDIAFLDMQMPEMDGAELGAALKADSRFDQMKLVMMTSIVNQEDAHYFSDLGFSAYFSKPTTVTDLFDALSIVAGDGETPQQARPLITHHYLQTHKQKKEEGVLTRTKKNRSDNTRLLLVEDNQVNQLVAKGILTEIGYITDVAGDGLEALDSLRQTPDDYPYNLILMDCQMPEMDGYEATQKIREGRAGDRYKSIPIIAMTANAMTGDREKCINAGMDDYLSKPVAPDQLASKLDKWLLSSKVNKSSGSTLQSLKETDEENLLVWDKEDALKRILGNEELLKTLSEVFLYEAPERLLEFQKALKNGDCEQIRQLAHSLKGVAANLSGQILQKQATKMEVAAKASDMQKVEAIMPQLIEAIDQLKLSFEQYNTELVNSTQSQSLSDDELVEFLQQLTLKLEQNDYIDQQDLVPLSYLAKNPEAGELISQLQNNISQLENTAAIRTIDKITTLTNSDI
jgi:two-component system, sensor histidine kinase and response regulator